jgi:hypothetical protein
MDWGALVKEAGAAVAMAALLLWRFERMMNARAIAEAQARDAFLKTLEQESERNRTFLGNHMSENRASQNRMAETLGHLCEQSAVVAAVIQKCAGATEGEGGR